MTTDHPEGGGKPDSEQGEAARQGSAALAAAAKTAQQALEGAKGLVSQAHLEDVGARAADAASNLYREGRDRLANSEELAQATEQLSAAVRRNPLAAVGIAFSAGILIALLTRG
jgi:ElaB/YqjD/DUF883 family membrane-anchored ribosome-binding protein